jgi:hypothetical protein
MVWSDIQLLVRPAIHGDGRTRFCDVVSTAIATADVSHHGPSISASNTGTGRARAPIALTPAIAIGIAVQSWAVDRYLHITVSIEPAAIAWYRCTTESDRCSAL